MNDTIRRMIDENLRYMRSGNNTGDVTANRRAETAAGQKPYAAVVTCSDSRVIPEAVFGAGIGELFVVRTAGNVIGTAELASLAYAVEHLGVKTLIVMGHTGCGAVGAAMNGEVHGAVGSITRRIKEAIGDQTDPRKASAMNVQCGVDALKKAFPHQDIVIAGMVYDIVSGKADLIE